MVARLVQAANELALFPSRYRIRKTRRSPAKEVRAMPCPPFMIYYRVQEPALGVSIIAIRHGARRQPRGFP
jgi:plasmid stabilization system protein ParE